MYHNLARRRQTRRHKHRLPHDRLLAHLVLARELYDWPPFLKCLHVGRPTDSGDVINKSIEPDEHDVCFVVGNGNAPRHFVCKARDTEIFKPFLFDKRAYFVQAKCGYDKIRPCVIKFQELALIFRETEKIIFFLTYLKLKIRMNGAAAVRKFRVGFLKLTADAVL